MSVTPESIDTPASPNVLVFTDAAAGKVGELKFYRRFLDEVKRELKA